MNILWHCILDPFTLDVFMFCLMFCVFYTFVLITIFHWVVFSWLKWQMNLNFNINIQYKKHSKAISLCVPFSLFSGDAWWQRVVFQWFPGCGHSFPWGPSMDSGRCISDRVLQHLRQRTGPHWLCTCKAPNQTLTHPYLTAVWSIHQLKDFTSIL